MVSPATSLKDMLISDGVAVLNSGSWLVRVGRLVETQDQLITLMDTPGQNPNPKWLVEYPTVQALIRGAIDDYDGGWTKAKAVKDALLGRDPEVVNGDSYDAITGLGDLSFLMWDQKNRPIFVMNFRLIVEPASGTHREAL